MGGCGIENTQNTESTLPTWLVEMHFTKNLDEVLSFVGSCGTQLGSSSVLAWLVGVESSIILTWPGGVSFMKNPAEAAGAAKCAGLTGECGIEYYFDLAGGCAVHEDPGRGAHELDCLLPLHYS